MVRHVLSAVMMLMLAALVAIPAAAQEDVRGVKLSEPALKVIEEKCLVCHNKKRIDAAIQERKDSEEILRRMGKKGVVLTDTERQVMGHFWPSTPFKEKPGEAPPRNTAK